MPANKSKSGRSKQFYGSKKEKKSSNLKLLCRYCHAVYDGKGWIAFEKMDPLMIDQLHASVCPACHETMQHVSDGVLHISGSGVKPILQEIKNMIAHMGKQAEAKNVLDRVERVEAERDGIVVYTTLNQLAVRIGKNVASAHKGGKLDIRWSKGDKPVEVYWTFDKK